ncbi:MAG: ABC transporter ATP-binding protein [Chloroflexota bacterium]|nr:ABC transporter ATP-binding protein [Chloroflexota bacterium]
MLNADVRKFMSYYKPYRRRLITDVICALIVAATALMLPLIAGHITGTIVQSDSPDRLSQIYLMGVLMLALVIVQTVCNFFVDYQGHMMGTWMERDMRAELFDHYQRLSFGFYDEERTGQLMSRLVNDLRAISELAHHGPEEGLIALLKFVGAFVIMLTINVEVTLAIFLLMPIMAVWALYFSTRLRAALERSSDGLASVNAQVEDTLAGIRVVQSFANEDIERHKFTRENERFVASWREAYRSEAYFSAGIGIFSQLLTIALIVFGSVTIVGGSLDLSQLVTYLLFVAILIDPIQKLVNLARLLQEGITGFSRFREMMTIAPQIVDAPDAIELTTAQGNIAFEDVSFRYRDEHNDVLRSISLDIRAGEYVALVGSSGVGKTTLCSLIPRFYEVSAGRILLDGVDIRDVTLRSLRRQIGVVQQDVYLFAGTVADNIAYGKPGASREEIMAAAQRANAHSFIMALPQGYDTDIGQRGVKLSGGQKQRLSIARVFLKDPPILIFDEATSALDNETERAVQTALDALAHNRTTLVIAHRLTTIRNAQRILVLTERGIEEQGTHDALLAQGGVYAELYAVQARV